ncbi:MAG TPA: PHP domain-containing protein [Gemmatimonadaceae bacterium]|jgi:hypothetical protein
MLLGALHCHSTYSDGELTLRELRDAFVTAGCSFACVTDHAEYLDRDRLPRYVAECAELSSEEFVLIPGLEFSCRQRMHVLGIGITTRVYSDEPEDVIAHINSEGGLSAIAHPRDDAFGWIETFAQLPAALETWNTKYDGRYAPRARTFRLLARLQERQPTMKAVYGLDLHWRRQYRSLLTRVAATAVSRDAILYGLIRGEYVGIKDGLELPANGALSPDLLWALDAANARSSFVRTALRRAYRVAKNCGLEAPKPLKAQLRRLF